MTAGLGYGSVIPDAPGADLHSLTAELAEKVGKSVEQYVEAMEKVFPWGNAQFISLYSLKEGSS